MVREDDRPPHRRGGDQGHQPVLRFRRTAEPGGPGPPRVLAGTLRGSNLLAAVLVRNRDALDQVTLGRGAGRRESGAAIMGGHVEKTWEKLDPLVSDATFMWEESSDHVADARRERAQQQVKAAEIFASFQRRFRSALDDVSGAMSSYTHQRDTTTASRSPAKAP